MWEGFKILKGYEGISGVCFCRIELTKTRGHSMELYKERVYNDVCKYRFGKYKGNRPMDYSSPEYVISATSNEQF